MGITDGIVSKHECRENESLGDVIEKNPIAFLASIFCGSIFKRLFKKVAVRSRSRRAIISTGGIHGVCRGLKGEPNTDIDRNGAF
jgi:hypothetical protein